jgi:uroporphyrinogen-III synthase
MASALLSGLTVILTRPLHTNEALGDKISQLQGQPYFFPTIAIEPVDLPTITATLKNINESDIVIFISQNAVRAAAPFLPGYSSYCAYAVGPSTAQALKEVGISVNEAPVAPFTSEALLCLPSLKTVKDKKITLIAGEGGRSYLEDNLRLRGAEVNKISVYRRVLPKIEIQLINQIVALKHTVIVITSGDCLLNLIQVTESHQQKHWLYQQTLLVVSPRIEQIAQSLNFDSQKLVTAQNATEPAILDALIKWYASEI